MEEIDIIELLQRVKEGKAPKLIEINDEKFVFTHTEHLNADIYRNGITELYSTFEKDFWFDILDIDFDTKIKILDKLIIEELSENDMFVTVKVGNKINEIIKFINNKE